MSRFSANRKLSSGKVKNIVQGEFDISDDPEVIMSTMLGSCVAVCLHDRLAEVGGMNHFLLPEGEVGQSDSLIFGLHSMELLINGLLKKGAMRNRLEAKVFGGAQMIAGLSDIGERNAIFAREFLHDEGFAIVGECTGGRRGRRLRFWPTSGRVQQKLMSAAENLPPVVKPQIPVPSAGDMELF